MTNTKVISLLFEQCVKIECMLYIGKFQAEIQSFFFIDSVQSCVKKTFNNKLVTFSILIINLLLMLKLQEEMFYKSF